MDTRRANKIRRTSARDQQWTNQKRENKHVTHATNTKRGIDSTLTVLQEFYWKVLINFGKNVTLQVTTKYISPWVSRGANKIEILRFQEKREALGLAPQGQHQLRPKRQGTRKLKHGTLRGTEQLTI